MRLNFRQGIVKADLTNNVPDFITITPSGLNINTSNTPVVVAFAHGSADYYFSENADVLNAWPVAASPDPVWLYWDLDVRNGVRTFGYTNVEPVHGPTQPATLTDGLHWFDTTEMRMKVYNQSSSSFLVKIRVFAAKYDDGILDYYQLGSQVGVQSANYIYTAGRIAYDNNGVAIRKSDGTFFNTEDQFFLDGSVGQSIRLESTVIFAVAQESIPAFSVVRISDFGQIQLADYEDIGEAVLAIASEDAVFGDVITISTQGTVVNPSWNWQTVNAELWVDVNGVLTDVDPNETNPLRVKQVPIARVISHDTILFEQGLGGKGEKGDPGSVSGVSIATTTTHGLVQLATAPADPNLAIVVGTNDPRLTDARVPLAHTHLATQVSVDTSFDVNYSAANLQDFVQEIVAETNNFYVLTGVAFGSANLGAFNGNIIPDNLTVKGAIQSLEDASTINALNISTNTTNITTNAGYISDHLSVLGVASGETDLGDFTGNLISSNVDIKTALQELETAVETNATTGPATYPDFTALLAVDGATNGEQAFIENQGNTNEQGTYATWINVDYTISSVTSNSIIIECPETELAIYNKILQGSQISVVVSGSDGGVNDGTYTTQIYTLVPGVGYEFTINELIPDLLLANNGILSFFIWKVDSNEVNDLLQDTYITNTLSQIWNGSGETSPETNLDLGVFNESIFTNNTGIKQVLQQIETILANFTIPYDFGFFIGGSLNPDLTVGSFLATRDITIPAGATGSLARCGIAPAADTSLDIKVNGSIVGTITFLTGSASGSFTVAAQISILTGDTLELSTQSTVDSAIADISITLVGSAYAPILNA